MASGGSPGSQLADGKSTPLPSPTTRQPVTAATAADSSTTSTATTTGTTATTTRNTTTSTASLVTATSTINNNINRRSSVASSATTNKSLSFQQQMELATGGGEGIQQVGGEEQMACSKSQKTNKIDKDMVTVGSTTSVSSTDLDHGRGGAVKEDLDAKVNKEVDMPIDPHLQQVFDLFK